MRYLEQLTNGMHLTTLELPRPLGSVGAKGNLLQTGEKYTYRPISGLDHIFTLDGERMIYNNGSSVYIVSTSSTQVFDVIDWSNDILRGYWMSADERVLCVLGLKKLLFYDVRNSSIIGVANQFGSIARFQWSTLDRQFYIWHNHSKFGLYDLASIPLSVHETARVQSMCSSEFYIDDGRLCMNAQSPLPVSWQLFDLTGNFVAGSSATSTSAWQECALDIATQPLLLRVDYGDFVAVDDLTLTVPAGEVFGLVGPNGAGKTCLLYTSPSPRD